MIHLENVSMEFDGEPIFSDVNLTIKEGESAVLIGPSGSGKSVLLKLISGLLQPTSGVIKVDSDNLGMLFQKNALFDSLSVEENLSFPLLEATSKTEQEAPALVTEMLNAVQLPDSHHLFPADLSGGMQKRLGIARALIIEPKVILYDEPTAGLDPITSRVIAGLILDLKKKRGSTVLTVTTDVQRALQLGDKIYLLANGKLTDGGTAEEVRNTKDEALRQFVYGMQKGPLTSTV